MANYDFDKVIDRRGTGSYKYERMDRVFGRKDLIPLWVADMDFETPPFIVEALRRRLDHPVFGYTVDHEDYKPSVIDWVRERHGWDIRPGWISYIPGIVKGIGMVISAFMKEGDKVVIQPPVYHPFRIVPESNNLEVVFNPLIERGDGGYDMDLEGLEAILSGDPACRMLILSNPHNPAGIVWPRETLAGLAAICRRHGVLVISDEIHCDMALFGNKHVPFASVSEDAAACSITFQAPSKTFNIAGIVSSYAVVPDDKLREKFFGYLEANELGEPDIFAPIATVAAFRQGKEWLSQMLAYIEGNVLFVEDFLSRNIPGIKALRPEASFLVWLDCRGLGLSHEQLITLFVDKAGLALNDGAMFGPGGEGFMRLNVGCPRSILEKALGRLASSI